MIKGMADKYGLSEDQMRRLIDSGRLGCVIVKHEEILNEYNSCILKGINKSQAVANAAHVGKVSERQVYKILNIYK